MKLSEALSRAKEAQELVMSMVLNKDDLLNQRTKALQDLIGAVESFKNETFRYIDVNVKMMGETDWETRVQLEDMKQYLENFSPDSGGE